MNAPCRQEEEVARMYLVLGEDVGEGVVLDAGFVLGGRHLLGESRPEPCALVGVHDIPHFGFAFRLVTLPRQPVVGVYLNREILPRVDELDQQRELLAETFEVGFAEQCGAVAGDQARQGSARFGTSGHDRFVAFDARKLPAFADLRLAGCDLFVGDDFFAAPDRRFENGLELIHNSFIVLFARRAGSGRTRMRPPKWRCSRRVSK